MARPVSVLALLGQNVGPGDRQELIERARAHLADIVDDVQRVDVPAKGTAGEGSDLRPPVDSIVPALQSSSLFGSTIGLLVVDADQLTAAEAEVIAGLLPEMGDSTAVAFVAFGAVPSALSKAIQQTGEIVRVRGLGEREASSHVLQAAKGRGLRLDAEAVAALIQRFGADRSALTQAVEQLAASDVEPSAEYILERFQTRPDEPMWFFTDAVVAGDTGEALRRLADFLTHGHPLALLGYLQGEIRLHALASGSPDYDTFVERAGGRISEGRLKRVWSKHRTRGGEGLSRALAALARADGILKTDPEPTHRITMERLTVALCMWYGRG